MNTKKGELMKVSRVFASVCLMSACAFVGAMDFKRDEYLKFKLDKDLHIVGHKAKHMEFLVSPADFTGKVITEAVPLSPEDVVALTNGFQKARTGKQKEKVPYTLKDKQFVAAIKHKKDSFSVKVKEVRS